MTATADATMVKSTFHFKKEKIRDEKGNVVGEGRKHDAVQIDLPIPSAEMLAKYLLEPAAYSKELELVFNALTDQVYRVARSQINDFREKNSEGTVTAGVLDYSKLSWTAIANMPKGERASNVPSDDDIQAFLTSYLEVMPAAFNRSKDKIETHILCFQTNFKKQRTAKDILEVFKNALAVYVTAVSPDTVEEHADVLDYFNSRLDKLLGTEDKLTVDDL